MGTSDEKWSLYLVREPHSDREWTIHGPPRHLRQPAMHPGRDCPWDPEWRANPMLPLVTAGDKEMW